MDQCSVCHNKTIYKKITYIQWYKGHLVAVENVPAEICQNCGEEYFSPDVADEVQKKIKSDSAPKTIEIPVYQLT